VRISLAFLVGLLLVIVAIPAFLLSFPLILATAAIGLAGQDSIERRLVSYLPVVLVGRLASWCLGRINP
jgi:hypothetical protein